MKLKQTLTTAALTACLAGSAYAAPLATATVSAAGIDFALQGAGTGSYTVVVGGPDGYYSQQDFSGQAPFFSLAAGNTLAEGTYTWTLTENRVAGEDDRRTASYKPRTLNGSFTIKADGSVADPSLPEDGFDKAAVVTQDQIVQGSQCVGLDCASSESFSFDTIRLKENNLRIHFDDTSASASFPGNDWRLVGNDSSNGGGNYFAIEDATAGRQPFKVEAGARANALYVEEDGHVGIGTANPVVNAHIVEGNSPTLRLEQDGSSGFSSQTWDIAGNETNFFIRDVTNSSKLPFRIKPGAPDNSIFIAANGDVGLGTDNPKTPLHILDGGSVFSALAGTAALLQNNASTTDGVFMSLMSGTEGTAQMSFGDSDNQFAGRVVYENSNGDMDIRAESRVQLQTNGVDQVTITDGTGSNLIETTTGAVLTSAGVWQSVSRRDAKTNISPLSARAALQAFSELQPVTYNYKVEPNDLSVGFIAEDVPDLVATASHKTLASLDLIALLTKVVQEQQKMIDGLEARMSDIE